MNARGSAAREEGPLGLISRRSADEARQAAWWADVTRWVDGLRASYDALWPESNGAVEQYSRKRHQGWPKCWQQHSGLVEDLVGLKVWQEALLDDAQAAGGGRGWCEWRSYLDSLVVYTRAISEKCTPWHRETPAAQVQTPVTAAQGHG